MMITYIIQNFIMRNSWHFTDSIGNGSVRVPVFLWGSCWANQRHSCACQRMWENDAPYHITRKTLYTYTYISYLHHISIHHQHEHPKKIQFMISHHFVRIDVRSTVSSTWLPPATQCLQCPAHACSMAFNFFQVRRLLSKKCQEGVAFW